jgi:hypothetical protein
MDDDEASGASARPARYRDGLGRPIPDVDLELRAKAQAAIARRFTRRLEYAGNFRAGTVTYVDDRGRIDFPHEMGGGGVHAIIDVPKAADWERVTSLPLAERDEIVRFVAETVQREQAPSWRFEITADAILFR